MNYQQQYSDKTDTISSSGSSSINKVKSEQIKSLKKKLDRLNVPSRALNQKCFKMVKILVQEVLRLKYNNQIMQEEFLSREKDDIVRGLMSSNFNMQAENNRLSKQVQKLSEVLQQLKMKAIESSVNKTKDFDYKFLYEQECLQKKRVVTVCKNSIKKINIKLRKTFQNYNSLNQKVVIPVRKKPPFFLDQLDQYCQGNQQLHATINKLRKQLQHSKEFISHLKQIISSKKHQNSRLLKKIKYNNQSLDALAARSTIQSLYEQKKSLNKQLELVLRKVPTYEANEILGITKFAQKSKG